MSISRTMYKTEIINDIATLMWVGDGEIDNLSKDEETGVWTNLGKKPGIILKLKGESGEIERHMSHSSSNKSACWKLIQECYGIKETKKAISFNDKGFADDVDYFFGLIEYLQGQKFELTIEKGKWTKIKEMTLIGELKLPTKEECHKRSEHLAKAETQAKAAAKEAFGDYPDKPVVDSNPDDFDGDEIPF